MLPCRFIYDHVISYLFIATHEWHELYEKLLGETPFCSPGSGCLEVDIG